MNIFINAVSSIWTLILFNDSRQIIHKEDIEVMGNESSKLITLLDIFLDKNKVNYEELNNIVVVAWPWSFTWIRTIVLLVNTINFVIKKNITSINFFDLFDNYPIIKKSSKRDSFIKFNKNSDIRIMNNEDIKNFIVDNNIKSIYWDVNKTFFDYLDIYNIIDYNKFISNVIFDTKKIIEPIYIKKPSIS